MSTLGFHEHNHTNCIADGVAAATQACEEQGLKLTKTRQRVLEILLQEHRALGAYEVLDRLREEGIGSQPPIAYRALDFLVANGFAHRIERLNAFVACTDHAHSGPPAFLICRNCNAVAETASEPMRTHLANMAKETGFSLENTVVEAEGICPKCQESA